MVRTVASSAEWGQLISGDKHVVVDFYAKW
jgi:hypothetical protein